MRRAATNSSRITPAVVVSACLFFFSAACGHKAVTVQPPVLRPPPAIKPAPKPVPPAVTPAPTPKSETGTPVKKPVPPGAASVSPDFRGPLVRINLTVPEAELRISAPGEFVLVEKTPEAARQTLTGQVQVRMERTAAEPAEVYRVQVASLASQSAAERLGQQLSERISQPAVLRENKSNGNTQVRIGRFTLRDQAQAFASGLLFSAGYTDAFVVRELGESGGGEPVLALRGPDNLFRISRAGYLFLPASEINFLRLNGKPYRGALDVSFGKDGRVRVVNQLGMEEYLLGVVPAELSPVAYPDTAALEAQAIAARTFALKNMGRFRNDGYDLTDDAATQVYGGASLEKDISNVAVRKTLGVAIYYNGSLIDAMYMSTCGGRTEDFANVFDTAPVPYLKSVFCTVENSRGETPEAGLAGSHDLNQVVFVDDGTPANRELELALVLGLIDSSRMAPEAVGNAPSPDELRGWVEKSRILGGRSEAPGNVRASDINSRAGFLHYAARCFFGEREIDRTVSDPDTAYYLSNFIDGAGVPDYARRTIAYLALRKLWQPFPDNSIRSTQPVMRADALALLVRWILSARPEVLKTAVVAEPGAGLAGDRSREILAVKRGSRTERLRLAQNVRLFKTMGGRSMPVTDLHIIGGEKVAYHQRTSGEVDFLDVELSPTGASSDRLSPVATWQVSIPRAVAAEKLRTLAGNVGEIQDLKPARLGNSGRVVQLEIIGSRRSVVVNGYKARGALGLKDTLYTLSRTPAEDGTIASFTFDGRGWGHGIGLCQTGAVGMARAGRSAEEILSTYYRGIELRKAY